MSSFRVLTRNILSSWMAYAVQVVISFFLTPFILHEIGDTRYGAWVIVVSITGYYGLLDLGLRAGITQYITRYYSTGEVDRMNKAASSGLALHFGCAICALLFTILAASEAPTYFSLSADLKQEARWCIAVVGCSTALQFLLFPFSVALAAKQRFDIITASGIMARILSALGMVYCLRSGYGLVGLCFAAMVSNAFDYLLRGAIAMRVVPELRMSWRLINRKSCLECISFASWSAVISTSTLVIGFSDAIVIGIFMPSSAITFFALASNLVRYFTSIFVPVGHVFYPATTALDASNNIHGLRTLYLTASRVIALQAVAVALIACYWAGDFYSLWVGDAYLQETVFVPVPLLFRVLIIGAAFTAAQVIGSKVLLGRRKTRGLAWLTIAEAVLNLIISITLIGRYGLLGVAIGTVVPAILCQGVIRPLMVCVNLDLKFTDYAREIIGPTLATALLLVPSLGLLHQLTPHSTWAALLFEGMAAIALAVVIAGLFGLTSLDRRRYVYPTLRRIPGIRQFFVRAEI